MVSEILMQSKKDRQVHQQETVLSATNKVKIICSVKCNDIEKSVTFITDEYDSQKNEI